MAGFPVGGSSSEHTTVVLDSSGNISFTYVSYQGYVSSGNVSGNLKLYAVSLI